MFGSMFALLLILAILVAVTAGFFYVRYVSGHVTTATDAIGKANLVAAATTFWGKINAKLLGWKTIILAWIAGVVQLVAQLGPDVVSGWKDLPWAQVFDAKVANWITIVCAILIPLTHSLGMKQAALAPPVDPNA